MNVWWLEGLGALLGGGLGAWCRFALSVRLQDTAFGRCYPWTPILMVNILGCFFIGVLFALFMHRLNEAVFLRAFLVLGLLGGLTTFSSFSMDTVKLLLQGQLISAGMNIILSVFCSLAATLLAYRLTLWVIK